MYFKHKYFLAKPAKLYTQQNTNATVSRGCHLLHLAINSNTTLCCIVSQLEACMAPTVQSKVINGLFHNKQIITITVDSYTVLI